LRIYLFVSTQYTNVTDRLTDRRTDGHHTTAIRAMYSVARQKPETVRLPTAVATLPGCQSPEQSTNIALGLCYVPLDA